MCIELAVEDADDVFFFRVLHNENNVLHPLLPERNDPGCELCRQRHERANDAKRNFIYRQLQKCRPTNF